jgi:hypothetical protein
MEQVEVKIVKPALNKNLPPQNPSRAALLGLKKPPLVPKEANQQGRRLSGDYFSNFLGDRAPSPREASNGIYRVPSAGGLRRPPSPNLRIHYY